MISETKTITENRVYVACLACYNEGKINGQWMTADELEIAWEHDWVDESTDKRILCPHDEHEEWAIHDYDGDVSRLNMGEHPDIPELIEHMNALDDYDGTSYVPAFLMAEEMIGRFPSQEEVENLMDVWEMVDDTSEWAEELCSEIYHTELEAVPHFITVTIDWEWVADQLLHDYYSYRYGTTIYLIRHGEDIVCE